MYFLQEGIIGGMGLTATVILTVTTGFALLACFIYWYYRKFTKTAETATNDEPLPAKRKMGVFPYIIIILLIVFIFLLVTLLSSNNTAYE